MGVLLGLRSEVVFGFGKKAESGSKGAGKIGGLVGLAMFAGAAAAMWWNESRTVNQAAAIAELSKNAVEISATQLDPAREGKAVYVSGTLETDAGVFDSTFNLGGDNVLVINRDVEMYQWVKHRRNKKDVWEEEWSDDAEGDGGGHTNPSFPVEGGYFAASDAHLGAIHIPESQVLELEANESIQLPAELSPELSNDGWRVEGIGLYRGAGSPGSPQIGDVRVKFTMMSERVVSAMGTLSGGNLVRYLAKNGVDVFFIEEGKLAPKVLVEHAETSNTTMAYIIRGSTAAAMALGLGIAFSGFMSWLTWIPVLGPMIERFAFWLGGLIGGSLALIVFVGAWLWTHPIALVATVALISAGLIAWGVRKRAQPEALGMPAQMAAPPPPPGFGPPGPPPPPR